MRALALVLGGEEALSFRQFLDLSPADRETVRTVRVEPARLGHRGFGRILVTFKRPFYSPIRRRSAR